jgi:hypothetical protein
MDLNEGIANGKETRKMIYDLLTAKNSALRSMLRLLVPAERARTEMPLWKERNERNECWMLEKMGGYGLKFKHYTVQVPLMV